MTRFLMLLGALAACSSGGARHEAPAPSCDGCEMLSRSLTASRGSIVDRHGVAFTATRPESNVYITPSRFDDRTRTELIRALGLDADEVAHVDAMVATRKMGDRHRTLEVLEDLAPDRVQRLQQAALPGVEVRVEAHRVYLQGDLAAHAIGYTTPMVAEEIDRLLPLGYEPSDRVGRYGVEAAWETYLRGKAGVEKQVVDAQGQPVDDPAVVAAAIQGPRRIEPVAGDNLVLTIDAELQRLAEQAVASYPSAAVALVEVDTGRVLALVSKPSFDPSVLAGHMTAADLAALQADPGRPFIDKTVSTAYPPGATYDFVTAIAALEDGVTRADEKLACTGSLTVPGRTFTCSARHGDLDLVGALQRSCDVHLWQLAERIGIDRMSEVAQSFGFGTPTGIGINAEAAGRVPTKAWYTQRGAFDIGLTLDAATGQGDVQVTVIQLAMAYAALAGDGTLHVPQIVEQVASPGGDVVSDFTPKISSASRPIAPEILDVIRRAMGQAVNQRGGIAYAHGHSAIVEIAGQAGTGAVRPRANQSGPVPASHAWFAGWAPASHPEVAIAVLIEHGGAGAEVAAPVARTILEGWWRRAHPP